ncbi:conserved hypothetical protein [Talaromyces stipitatus ATCC 10500]|uniref:Chromo domain-containing protein n=1 Tax=Talaromyces stipitatus (strain ATCC 10500 / CBS 375.48 / QM 6759 / NRRL 1006) TaxID=441959 RepID=B8MAJ5_TALSN|nr:uncharacterized protein TSTA_112530 [Talaromyces stipitatus ATCC 10500]EED17419.1 conserved hypothetical protein [Talaromyces stipitatus ATCC 10500]
MKVLYFYLHIEIINQNKLTTGYYNEKHQKGPNFKKGEKEKISEVNYKLRLLNTIRVHPIFHILLLELAPQNAKTQEEITIEQETYKVKSILAEKESPDGKLYYLVKWKDYSIKESTWEPIENLVGAEEVLERTGEPCIKLLDGRSKSTGF